MGWAARMNWDRVRDWTGRGLADRTQSWPRRDEQWFQAELVREAARTARMDAGGKRKRTMAKAKRRPGGERLVTSSGKGAPPRTRRSVPEERRAPTSQAEVAARLGMRVEVLIAATRVHAQACAGASGGSPGERSTT